MLPTVCCPSLASFANDVLACTVVSSLVVPFVTFACECLAAGALSDGLLTTLEKVLNRNSLLYQRHALTARRVEGEVVKEWTDDLKVGDPLDALHPQLRVWLPADIVEVSDLYGLKVAYVGVPKSQQYYNGYFTRESTCLAPRGTKARTEDELAKEPWRQALAKGDCVDGADALHKWYTAKILETRDPKVPGGPKQVLVTYDGWSSYYNEWLPVSTFMIQPHRSRTGGSQTFGLAGAIPATVVQEDVVVDSSEDPDDGSWAVPRERRLGGVLMTEVVQAFGAGGGPTAVLQAILSSGGALAIPTLQKLCAVVAAPSVHYNTRVLGSYALQLRDAVFGFLLALKEHQLRDTNTDALAVRVSAGQSRAGPGLRL